MKKAEALIIGAGMAIGAYFLFGGGSGGEGAPLTAGQARESGRQAQLLSKMFRKFEAGLESLSMTQVEAYQSLAAEFRAGLSDISTTFSQALESAISRIETQQQEFYTEFKDWQSAIESKLEELPMLSIQRKAIGASAGVAGAVAEELAEAGVTARQAYRAITSIQEAYRQSYEEHGTPARTRAPKIVRKAAGRIATEVLIREGSRLAETKPQEAWELLKKAEVAGALAEWGYIPPEYAYM